MKKARFLAVALSAALSLTLFAGCGGKTDPDKDKDKTNTPPTITGVEDAVSITAGTEFDALKGVTASDKEDGDLTSEITVESTPALTFTGGKTTPTATGDYELIYSVKDSGDAEGNAYCTLTVTPAAGEEKTLKSYTDFNVADKTLESDKTDGSLDYWTPHLDANEAEGTIKQTKGALVFGITDRKNAGDDKIMLSRRMDNLKAGKYEMIVWAKSSVATEVNMNALLEGVTGDGDWDKKNLDGGKYNIAVGTGLTEIRESFSLTEANINNVNEPLKNDKDEPINGEGEASILFRICLGGNGDENPDNPEGPRIHARPEAFDFTIYKVALYCITGSDSAQKLYEQNFDAAVTDAVTVNAGDGSEATTSYDAAAKAQTVNITSYATSGGVWSLKVDVALGNVKIEKGSQYSYSMKVKAQNAQGGELLVESKTKNDSARANFKGLALNAGEETTIENTFIAEDNVDDPVIRFQIGTAGDGNTATSNVITIDDVVFSKTDEKVENKCNSYFALKKASDDAAYPFDFFNGSDEGSNSKTPGLATIYTENKNLVYHVFQGSSTDWHNKLIIGFGSNPLALPGNSYYTVRIKIKADKALTCPVVALHELDTDWDIGMIKKGENVAIGTDWTTIELKVEEPFIGDKNCELLFQFGSQAFAALGEVKIEIAEITILQRELIG